MDIEIVKKIGNGAFGTVFIAKYNKKNVIVKVQRFDEQYGIDSEYSIQLLFNDEVGTEYENRFLNLLSSSIISNCSKIKGYDHKKQKCYALVYEPVLKYTLHQLIKKMQYSDVVSMYRFLVKSISIMHENHYYHNDLHVNNIMCTSTKKNWYIIDYGRIIFIYPRTKANKISAMQYKIMDVLTLIDAAIYNPITQYMYENDLFSKMNTVHYIYDKLKIAPNMPKYHTLSKILYDKYDTYQNEFLYKYNIAILHMLHDYKSYVELIFNGTAPTHIKEYVVPTKVAKYFIKTLKEAKYLK